MPDAVEADDLGKHTAGHTLLAALWQRLSPVLAAYCQDRGMDPASSMEGVLEGLGQVLARREPSSAQWKDLEASACRYKDFVSSGQDARLSFHQDARQVTCLPGLCEKMQCASRCVHVAYCRKTTVMWLQLCFQLARQGKQMVQDIDVLLAIPLCLLV